MYRFWLFRPSKIESKLRERIAVDGSGIDRVIVSLSAGASVPPMPQVDVTRPDTDPNNAAILAERARIIEGFKTIRSSEQAGLMSALALINARVLESFWLINAIVVELPRATIAGLAERSDVKTIVLADSDIPPPTISQGRAVVGTDPYRNFGGDRIGLIDTGARSTHTLFVNPNPNQYSPPKYNQITAIRDCVNGTLQNCQSGNNLDTNDYWNHGTASASILVGNATLGDAYWGLTDTPSFVVYKVYGPPPDSGYLRDAGVRAFQAATANDDEIIVAEIQDLVDLPGGGPTVDAANAAFDANEMVIAAAGNFGPGAGTVRAPGIARGVIAVGAVDAWTLAQQNYQSQGPGLDGRIKPDLQGPTNTATASNASDTAILGSFSGTSGSTPYIAGAAALLRARLSHPRSPGKMYAAMIALGDGAVPNNSSGAGILRLPSLNFPDPTFNVNNVVTVSHGQTVDVPLNLSSFPTAHDLDAAIWWSTADCTTSNMTLQVINPSGVLVASSALPTSVWEKVRVSGSLTASIWTLRIYGESVASPQTVYVASVVRR